MKISIITPVFNSEKTIEKTILSVVNQKLKSDLEYIIIDGNSTDNTLKILHRYLEEIKIIVSEKDQGTYDAMNKGINLATGDIIGIINADDWYNDGALSSVEQAFSKDPEISIVYSPIKTYLDNRYFSTYIPGKLENLPFRFTIPHPSCFVKKEVYDQIGLFDLGYSMAADYDFIFRAYTAGYKFQCVDTVLASFALSGMTSQITNRLKLIKENWQVSSRFVTKTPQYLKKNSHTLYINWFLREITYSLFQLNILIFLLVLKIKNLLVKFNTLA
ncbi:glycosyl transferase [Westiellopsis prolifica IICB1]|nr:glycosyl transferase [Westiellopsis prolifica IICB1]